MVSLLAGWIKTSILKISSKDFSCSRRGWMGIHSIIKALLNVDKSRWRRVCWAKGWGRKTRYIIWWKFWFLVSTHIKDGGIKMWYLGCLGRCKLWFLVFVGVLTCHLIHAPCVDPWATNTAMRILCWHFWHLYTTAQRLLVQLWMARSQQADASTTSSNSSCFHFWDEKLLALLITTSKTSTGLDNELQVHNYSRTLQIDCLAPP